MMTAWNVGLTFFSYKILRTAAWEGCGNRIGVMIACVWFKYWVYTVMWDLSFSWWQWRLLPSSMWRQVSGRWVLRIWRNLLNISIGTGLPWRWRQQVPSKLSYLSHPILQYSSNGPFISVSVLHPASTKIHKIDEGSILNVDKRGADLMLVIYFSPKWKLISARLFSFWTAKVSSFHKHKHSISEKRHVSFVS
jgi:hypothetical protein